MWRASRSTRSDSINPQPTVTSPNNPFCLDGKFVLVTGASSGIGSSVAIEAAKLGATLIITGRNEQRLNEVLGILEGTGHRMIPADLTSDQDRESLIKKLPMLDGVSHNAGIVKTTVFKFLGRDKMEQMLESNFTSTMLLQRALLKACLINDGASLVFTASKATTIPSVGSFAYAASKGAMVAGSKVLAIELAPKRIRVNCVSPAMIRTRLLQGGALTEEEYVKNEALYPLGRYGKPEEVAWMICYLLSEASAWITGVDFKVDGGRSLI